MALDFKQVQVDFDYTSGIRQKQPFTVAFDSKVRRANAAIKGFRMKFKNDDMSFFEQEIDIDPDSLTVNGHTASGTVDFVLRDDSGLGNPYGGYVQLLVIAELE